MATEIQEYIIFFVLGYLAARFFID